MRIAHMMTLPPPISAGVTKKPRQSTKTMTTPAARPGSDSGKKICQKVAVGLAPRFMPARRQSWSMIFIEA